MSNYLCASDILIQCRKQIHCVKGLTRSEADSSSVYPMERKFAWRAANSFFKFPSNFFHPFKIFPFICREKFLSSPFTNGATICISKGWKGFFELWKELLVKVICDRGVSHYPVNLNFTNVNASQQCRSEFKLRASKALSNQPIYINTLFTDDYI